MGIELAIFDMDGTIFTCSTNWSDVRKKLDIRPGDTILENIFRDNKTDIKKLFILEDIEWKNTISAKPVDGVSRFIKDLMEKTIKTALITNNSLKNTQYLLAKFMLNFDLIITREMNMWKPDPAAIIYTIKYFDVKKENIVSFGDSEFDIRAYNMAGISDIYIKYSSKEMAIDKNNINFFTDFQGMTEKLFFQN